MLEWTQHLHGEGLQRLIATGGLLLLVLIVFAETGLLVGFFLPGDSLLFIGGAMTAVNLLDPAQPAPLAFWPTCWALLAAAILGNTVNWLLGHWLGERVWRRVEARDGRFLKKRYLDQAQHFYDRHGAWALVLTRFVPIARTFTPFIAGAARMPFGRYSLWNVVGALLWVFSMVGLGHWLGQFAFVREHIETLVLAVVAISVAPMAVHAVQVWRRGAKAAA